MTCNKSLILLLPIELQTRIFTLSQNPQIFYTCKHCYTQSQTTIVRAQYLYIRFDTQIYSKQATNLSIYTPQVLFHLLKWRQPQGDNFLSFACTLDLQSCQHIVNILPVDQQRRWLSLAIIADSTTIIPIIDLLLTKIPLQQSNVELACRLNKVGIVKHLVSRYQANVHVQDEKYLREACSNGYKDMVNYLLKGANIHAFHEGALVNAVYKQHLDIVQLLLENKAIPNHLSVRYAISNSHYDILKLLLKHGANPSCQQDWPLREACKKGLYKVVQLLLTRYHVNVEANQGEPLKEAISAGHFAIVELLLSYHADPTSLGAVSGLKVARYLNYHHIVNLVVMSSAAH
ncbi:ankyrin [Backusella circina FSU 941]|nr:ankyrin [Backusella circina FSU 941]